MTPPTFAAVRDVGLQTAIARRPVAAIAAASSSAAEAFVL
jgi:hypothetical protein